MRVREKEAGLEGLEEPEELMDGNGRVTMAWAKQLPTAARKKDQMQAPGQDGRHS